MKKMVVKRVFNLMRLKKTVKFRLNKIAARWPVKAVAQTYFI